MGAEWQGLRGPAGHVVLNRAGGAPSIRFEPASNINAPMRLIETLSWQRVNTDRPLFARVEASFGEQLGATLVSSVRAAWLAQ